MIRIYIAKMPTFYEEGVFQLYCEKVERQRQDKARRIKHEQSRMGSVLAGYLLQCAVKDMLGRPTAETPPLALEYRLGKYEKPYLVSYPEVFFNLSHSGRYVVCAIHDQEIGVDIQKELEVDDQLAKRFYTEQEYEMLCQIKDRPKRQKMFIRLWAVKESYIKLTGMGLSQGLDTFRIDWERSCVEDESSRRRAWFYEYKELSEAYLAVCSYEPIFDEDLSIRWVEI